MADDQGRGWHGDPEGHAKAGSQSSGNQGNPKQHAEAGRKGGQASQGGQRQQSDTEESEE